MPTLDQNGLRNRLLGVMSSGDFALLAPDLEVCDLPKSFTLVEKGGLIEHVYFPEIGIGSIVAASPEHGIDVEVGLFGQDGLGPVTAVLGLDRSPYRVLIQVAGHGHRIPRDKLAAATAASPSLLALFLRYVHCLNLQGSFTSLSNAVHTVDERLARWILMCHDRHPGDDIALTHDFIAIMLAVRRPSVTTSLHVLEGHLLIRNDRGHIVMRNRLALEKFARDAYGQPEAEYRRVIGPM